MAELNDAGSFSPVVEQQPLPSGLNVLTILTFIGSAIGLLGTLYNFTNAKKAMDQMEATINSPEYENMPALAKKFLSPEALEVARKSYENRIPLTLIGLVGIALCVYGALQMRKRKMQGYYLWLTGELLPLLVTVILVGTGALGGIAGAMIILFTVVFVLLYTLQRKHLTN
ncbi:MAG: hypothetical protein ABIU63_07170 [Chitinophagaceae bacterium]